MAISLVTGHKNEVHITSEQDGALNAYQIGRESYIYLYGESFDVSPTDGNRVRIGSGVAMIQGRKVFLRKNEFYKLPVAYGTAGYNRKDLVVIHYETDINTEVERVELKVIPGTPSMNPEPPEINVDGEQILDNSYTYDFPLAIVNIEGTEIVSCEQVNTPENGGIKPPIYDILDIQGELIESLGMHIENIDNSITNIDNRVTVIENGINDGSIGGGGNVNMSGWTFYRKQQLSNAADFFPTQNLKTWSEILAIIVPDADNDGAIDHTQIFGQVAIPVQMLNNVYKYANTEPRPGGDWGNAELGLTGSSTHFLSTARQLFIYDNYTGNKIASIVAGTATADIEGDPISLIVDVLNGYTGNELKLYLYYRKIVDAEGGGSIEFDNVPTQGSSNAVTSNGIYNALLNKQDILQYDAIPTQDSIKMLNSGAIWAALQGLGSGGGSVDKFKISSSATYNSPVMIFGSTFDAGGELDIDCIVFYSNQSKNVNGALLVQFKAAGDGSNYSYVRELQGTQKDKDGNDVYIDVYPRSTGNGTVNNAYIYIKHRTSYQINYQGIVLYNPVGTNIRTVSEASRMPDNFNPGGVPNEVLRYVSVLDNSVTEDSQNPVTSEGIYRAIQEATGGGTGATGKLSYVDFEKEIKIIVNVSKSSSIVILDVVASGKTSMIPGSNANFCFYVNGNGGVYKPYIFMKYSNDNVYKNLLSNCEYAFYNNENLDYYQIAIHFKPMTAGSIASAAIINAYAKNGFIQDIRTYTQPVSWWTFNNVTDVFYATEGGGGGTQLTFDTIPQKGSTNPVTSNGIYTQIPIAAYDMNSIGWKKVARLSLNYIGSFYFILGGEFCAIVDVVLSDIAGTVVKATANANVSQKIRVNRVSSEETYLEVYVSNSNSQKFTIKNVGRQLTLTGSSVDGFVLYSSMTAAGPGGTYTYPS